MALRVLLADESTTIKKVMQLALQDFAVEVKAVHSGLDVIEVARSFLPDIVFADVLLQKRNGYDVCTDLKKDLHLRSTPVVLMWSSFMDLDEKQYIASRANGKLEKPFDVESLRSLILELVPKTQSQRLAHFLRFPAEFVEPLEKEERRKREAPAVTPAPGGGVHVSSVPAAPPNVPPASSGWTDSPPASSGWNMDSFDDIAEFANTHELDAGDLNSPLALDEEFEPVKITRLETGPIQKTAPPPHTPTGGPTEEAEEPWSHQDLARFKLDIPEEGEEDISLVFDMNSNEAPVDDMNFLLNSAAKTPKSAPQKSVTAAPPYPPPNAPPNTTLTSEQSLRPVGEVHGIEGEMITQFAPPDDLENFDNVNFELESTPESTSTTTAAKTPPPIQQTASPPISQPIPTLDATQLERIIRAQSQEIIETVVRKIVPDIATDLIKKELERLLRDMPPSGNTTGGSK